MSDNEIKDMKDMKEELYYCSIDDEEMNLGIHVGRMNIRYVFPNYKMMIDYLTEFKRSDEFRYSELTTNLSDLKMSNPDWLQETLAAIADAEVWFDAVVHSDKIDMLHAVDKELSPHERFLKATAANDVLNNWSPTN